MLNYTDPANASQWPIDVPTPLMPLYAAAEILCCILSIGGNAVVIYVFMRKRSLRTVKNSYVVSLSVADLLVGVVGIPSALATSVGLPTHFEACLIMNSLLLLLCTASITSLMAVSFDRLWAIVQTLTYASTMTHCRTRAVIVLCWSVATFVGLLPLMGWHKGRPPVPRCFFMEVVDGRYLVFICVVTIAIPAIVLAGVYVLIHHSVRKQGRHMRQFSGAADLRGQKLQLSVEARAARTFAVIVVVFVVSWLPLYALNTVYYLCPTCHIPPAAFGVTIVLSHYNSVWNPLLYAWGMKDIRRALLHVVTRQANHTFSSTRSIRGEPTINGPRTMRREQSIVSSRKGSEEQGRDETRMGDRSRAMIQR